PVCPALLDDQRRSFPRRPIPAEYRFDSDGRWVAVLSGAVKREFRAFTDGVQKELGRFCLEGTAIKFSRRPKPLAPILLLDSVLLGVSPASLSCSRKQARRRRPCRKGARRMP